VDFLLLQSRKGKMFTSLTAMMLSCVLFLGLILTVSPYATKAADVPALTLEAQSAILIEIETGQILYEFNKDVARQPASMAKMMSEYVVLEAIQSGKLNWTDTATVSEYASNTAGSGALLAEGEVYTVEELFRNMSIFSGNDASVALAERVAGSEEAFAVMLNTKARELGLSDEAYFINATGLDRDDLEDLGMAPASLPGETMLSAHDAAIIAQRLILDYPEVLETSSQTEAYSKANNKGVLMPNWNWMLEGWKPYNNHFAKMFSYEGLDGLKTGHTPRALYNFTSTAKRGDIRVIGVIMAAPTMDKRFYETKKLLDYGFDHFTKMIAIQPKTEIEQLTKVNIKKGVVKEVNVVTESNAQFLVKKGTKLEDFVIDAVPADEKLLVAPIKKGQVLGELTVSLPTTDGSVMAQKVNLVAAADVEKASWFRLFFRAIGDFFKSLIGGIKNLF
jgi:D-alanyl-D-alanine carboxypeptidase (penicillin-binding protein 5/6)